MFTYKQYNFATGTRACLYLNSFVSFHGKTAESSLLAESVKEHENVLRRLVLATPTRVEFLIITHHTTLIFYYYLIS